MQLQLKTSISEYLLEFEILLAAGNFHFSFLLTSLDSQIIVLYGKNPKIHHRRISTVHYSAS